MIEPESRRLPFGIRDGETRLVLPPPGREAHKIILAVCQSAGEGRRIERPYEPPAYQKPIDLWKPESNRSS